jgi:carboxymethylenebutenolidase
MGGFVQFRRPDGQTAPGYQAGPAGPAPGVIVIQEWWGLNEQIKGTVDRLARAGFQALAPDIFRGRRGVVPDEANHHMSGLNWSDAADQDLRGAVQWLKNASAAPVAAMGFCMGGALTMLSLLRLPELDAGVCFYGIPPAQAADPGQIKKPLQVHFATQDNWCTPKAVVELDTRLKAGRVPFELYCYAAKHGFFNEQRPTQHEPKAAELAWHRSLAFLKARLMPDLDGFSKKA